MAPTTSTTVAPRSFTVAVTGDLLVHLPVASRARAYGRDAGRGHDFGPMFAEVAPVLQAADLAICHQETPLSRDDSDLSGYPRFNAPRGLAASAAAAGYDRCSTASNHSIDQGPDGIAATIEALEAAGLSWAGTARTAAEAAPAAQLLDVAGVRVAHLAYTYGLNGLLVPEDRPWLVNLIDADRVLADAAAAVAASAEFVLVSMHWGAEYRAEPTPEQRELATALLASPDVDLVVGHHTHVVGAIERIGTEYVIYGLGNFLSNQTPRCCPAASQDGLLVVVSVTETGGATGEFRATGLRYHPTWVEPGTYRIRLVADALADPATAPEHLSLLLGSWDRTVAATGQLVAAGDGIAPARRPPQRPR